MTGKDLLKIIEENNLQEMEVSINLGETLITGSGLKISKIKDNSGSEFINIGIGNLDPEDMIEIIEKYKTK